MTGEQMAAKMRLDLLRQEILAMPTKSRTLSFSIPLVTSKENLEQALNIVERTVCAPLS